MSRQKTLNLRTTVGGQELFARVAEYATDGTHIASSLVPTTQNMEGNVLFDTGHGYAWSNDVIETHVIHEPDAGLVIDGRTYRTVKIGNREWMAENLASDAAGGVWYDNDPTHDNDKYGKLYSPSEVASISVDGWHVPNYYNDMQELFDSTSPVFNESYLAAPLMDPSGWDSGYGSNDLEFNVVGAGTYSEGYGFFGAGIGALMAMEPGTFNIVGSENPPHINLSPEQDNSLRYSVRLVKDYDGENGVVDTPTIIDGKTYNTVRFGDDVWLAENLILSNCGRWYENNQANYERFGKLYNYDELSSINVPGWHLPTHAEIVNVLSRANYDQQRLRSTSDWIIGGQGDGTFGFNVMPSGGYYEYVNSGRVEFYSVGTMAGFWGADEMVRGSQYASGFSIYQNYQSDEWIIARGYQSIPDTTVSRTGSSIRLVKDKT